MTKNNILSYFVISVIILSASSSIVQDNAFAPNPLDLGTAQPFVLLSGGVITNNQPGQSVTGNTGHISTLTANYTYVTGSDFAGAGSLGTTATPGTPLGDQRAVLTYIGTVGLNGTHAVSTSGLACTFAFTTGAIDLATDTTHGPINQYAPGVYCINGAASIGTAGINLNATGTYIFKINGALTTDPGSSVTFNGAPGGSNDNADNVFWVPTSASTGATSQFSGTILSGSGAITAGANTNNTNARFISESAITTQSGVNTFIFPPLIGGGGGGGGGGGSGSLYLGTAQPFVLLSGSVITNNNPGQLVTGNTGHVSTLSAPYTYVTGSDFAGAGPLGNPATPGTPLGDQRGVLDYIGTVGSSGGHAVSATGLACTFEFANGNIDLATDTTHGQINQYAPGVYCINGAASIGTAGINLNATGTYIFKINGALTTVTGSSVTFNGAAGGSNDNADNVFWAPTSASTGATSQFSGTILSGAGAITVGANTNNTNARFISESAITTNGGANTFTIPPVSSSGSGGGGGGSGGGSGGGGGPLYLGTSQPFVLLSGGVITNGVHDQLVTGNTGHVSTLSDTYTYVLGHDFAGSILGTTATLGTPLGDQRAVLNYIGTVGTNGTHAVSTSGLACTFAFANGAIDLATDTTHGPINQYTPGVYCINGAASIGTAGINLNADGTYIFKINGALTTVTGSTVTFNGAAGGSNDNADNVFWVPIGGASTGATSQFSGTILAKSAAITTGANTNNTNARFISESAITTQGGANTFTIPLVSSSGSGGGGTSGGGGIFALVSVTVVTSGSSDRQWQTKPTFGVSYQTNQQLVTDGFGYDTFDKTITDNFHTPFSMAYIPTGLSYPLFAKGYFANELKIQEFCFGIPDTGKGYLAESCVEVHFDTGYGDDKKITDINVIQNTNVIGDVFAQHEMASCNTADSAKVCDKTMITVTFLEPLQYNVMMIKGIDYKSDTTETYLNKGFDVAGKQFTDLPTTMIASPTKYEGLLKVTESAKYSTVWVSDDGRTFERNSFGSFNQINQDYARTPDTDVMKERTHSAFAAWKDQQAIKATNIWDASKYVSTTTASKSSYDYPTEDHRTVFLKKHSMLEFARN